MRVFMTPVADVSTTKIDRDYKYAKYRKQIEDAQNKRAAEELARKQPEQLPERITQLVQTIPLANSKSTLDRKEEFRNDSARKTAEKEIAGKQPEPEKKTELPSPKLKPQEPLNLPSGELPVRPVEIEQLPKTIPLSNSKQTQSVSKPKQLRQWVITGLAIGTLVIGGAGAALSSPLLLIAAAVCQLAVVLLLIKKTISEQRLKNTALKV